MMDINMDLFQWSINFLTKRLQVEQLKMNMFLIKNQQKNCTNQLLENLREKVYSTYIDNSWCTDLADMQLISKFNKGFIFLLCFIYIFCKYAWVIHLKGTKGITITNASQKF